MLNGSDVEIDIEIEIQYYYHKSYRGARDSLGGKRGAGPPLEPDEPSYVEIEEVIELENGTEIELTETEQEHFKEKILDSLQSDE